MEYSSPADKEKRSVALSSIAGAVVITGLKVVVGFLTGSLGILSEAMHSGLDLVAAIVTFFAVRASAQPADVSHQYGHGKVENISALLETVLLLVTCFWIINEAIDRLVYHTVHVQVTFWSFFVMGISIVVDYSRSRALHQVAVKHRSQALEADALHFRTDIWSSGVVIFGLILTLLQVPVADSVAAIIVAVIVVYVSLSLGKRTIDDLLDRAPQGMKEKVRAIVEAIPDVRSVDDIRVRSAGPKMFVNLHVGIARTATFEAAHGLVDSVERALHAALPNADVLIHADPVETPDETIADKVRLLISREGLIAHDVQVFRRRGKYQVGFQLEFHRDEQFVNAHGMVDDLEARIKKEVPEVRWVIAHIEDAREEELNPVDITYVSAEVAQRLHEIALTHPDVRDCSVLSILEVRGKWSVSMNVHVDRTLSLEQVHTISTALENKIMVSFPHIKEVHIHTEPATV